jgi:hypothetical protein
MMSCKLKLQKLSQHIHWKQLNFKNQTWVYNIYIIINEKLHLFLLRNRSAKTGTELNNATDIKVLEKFESP